MLTDAYRWGGWVGLGKSVAYVICEWPLTHFTGSETFTIVKFASSYV